MADSKPLNKSIGTNITDAEMFRLFSDHLKTKWWNVNVYFWLLQGSKMCDDAVDNYVYALGSLSDCYKTQKMCNKAVGTYTSAI